MRTATPLLMLVAIAAFAACSDTETVTEPNGDIAGVSLNGNGVLVVNGWYEAEEIYYIDHGVEEGVTERGENDIYIIGEPRKHQANVVEFIPGEAGYSPHWNVHVVNTAYGVTVADILDSRYASEHFDEEGVLFDDVADILGAEAAGLVTIARPGVVVLCPIVPERVADAPGNTEAPEEFDILEPGDTF